MIGVDEAGRGSWAGPFLAVAIRLKADWSNQGLGDSKQLNADQRLRLAEKLQACEKDFGYTFIEPNLIDKYGLTWAQKEAMKSAVDQLKPRPCEEVIVDGSINYLKDYYLNSRAVVKADQKYLSVMAASILAKVWRDQAMIKLNKNYPQYSFDKHKGYGTKLHRQLLEKFKPLNNIHRLSYKPLQKFYQM